MSLESIIQQQQETLQRWHQQSSRDAEDLAESLVERFQVHVAAELDGFVWDFADDFVTMITAEWGDQYANQVDAHWQKTLGHLQRQLEAHVGNETPEYARTSGELDRRSLYFCVDKSTFKKAFDEAKPGVLGMLLSPSMDSERWDDWSAEQNQKILQSLKKALSSIQPKIARAISKTLDDAYDEYDQGLALLKPCSLVEA
ncbi:hypothetical protein [Acidithiobacillus sp.]|uniref:hypothetical protein n=1 Tax=Acidithiobacillus sp. TaxID=1872118 RepID=UPI002321E972|nr:hypothetical protein [Acidithiobacillus sp.]MDA8154713.1 hypothetical protein [Acidithiobacillus sp.]MDA8176301.1 hypothetical protein [Acidithiobacillus sp.]